MLHVSLFSDINVGAKPHVHPGARYPASVHLGFVGADDSRQEGYADITPDQADKLADDLKAAAEGARKLEAERLAKPEART